MVDGAVERLLVSHVDPAEHSGQKRPRPCNAERCYCKWIKFHIARTNAKLKQGSTGQ